MRLQPTEAETQKAILDWFGAERIFAYRINTAAFKTEGRFFRAHSLGKGAADIRADVRIVPEFELFQPLWVECKSPTGRQSDEQLGFQKHVEGYGHAYIVARSVEDVVQAVKKIRG